jgi:hypothetical protein
MRTFNRFLALTLLSSALITGCQSYPSNSNHHTLANLHAHPQAAKVQVELSAKSYHLNDPIRFRVTSQQTGRLWIVQVDPDDQATVLYPPSSAVDNRISANLATDLPNANWATEFRAVKPTGRSQLAFIVTPEKYSLDDILMIRNGKLTKTAFASDQSWAFTQMPLVIYP